MDREHVRVPGHTAPHLRPNPALVAGLRLSAMTMADDLRSRPDGRRLQFPMISRHLLPRPLRTWLRDRRRRRYAIEQHPIPTLTGWEKRQHLIEWVRRSGVRVFIETGTYLGETTLALREIVERCITIELDPALHARAQVTFAGMTDVELLLGDSGRLIR